VTDPVPSSLLETPLNALHRKLGAKMVPFAGYDMPLQYRGIIDEHLHTREQASLFDVSHMGQAILRGDGVAAALETVVVSDIAALPAGKMRYTLLTNDDGGIIDDLMVVQGGYFLFLVVNAARKAADFGYIRQRIGDRCDMEILEDRALLALQGPAAAKVMSRLAPPCRHLMFLTTETLTIAGMKCGVARSGYTGEDGYEITVDAENAETMARLLLEEPEVRPAGLGARDTLRLEAGLCLYGADLDETTTPIEAGLAWTINKRRREEGGFPGDEIILRQMAEGPPRRRVGLKPEGRTPARPHTRVTDRYGKEVGEVTSGAYGPSVGGPVAVGYVDAEHAEHNTLVNFIVRDRPLAGRVTKLPFIEHRYAR